MKPSSFARDTLLILVPMLCILGCSSGDSQGGVNALPVDKCDDVFRCIHGETAFDTTLHRDDGGRCMAGSVELRRDHFVVSANREDGWWAEEPNRFTICSSGECTTCESKSAPPPAVGTPAAEKCVGEPDGCYGRAAGSCSLVRGCRFVSHVKWNGSLEYSCEGYADSCKEFTDDKSCQRQGCDWK